ncbi:hypothetical protein [Micromonospora sp. DT31]|uniref:hypothetical protein n=1 Tax=Micromonospora sp. DT31 TaxID=3393434 RepID=UPI003CF8D216
MARRGWGGSTAAALGVAAGAGAAQLGFGYGLGIINWAPSGAARVEAAWVASLAWATWIAATSVVVGAVCAQRLRGAAERDAEPRGTLPRLGLALAAGVGALVTVLLVAVPARAAQVPDVSAPQAVAAGYAAAGLLLGVLLATWALHTRAAATNLIATSGWLWLLAVVSVVDGVIAGRGLSTAQLGIWQISADRGAFWIRDYFYWPGALLSLFSALVIGVVAARRAARSPGTRVGAAASGAAGPLLVALAYLLAVPRLAGIAAEQLSAHLIAPYAVIAGVGGSALIAALAQRADRRGADPTREDVPGPRVGEAEPTAGKSDATREPAGPDEAPSRSTDLGPKAGPAEAVPTGAAPTEAAPTEAAPAGAGLAEATSGGQDPERRVSPGRGTRTADRRERPVPSQRRPGSTGTVEPTDRGETTAPVDDVAVPDPAGTPTEPRTRRRAR